MPSVKPLRTCRLDDELYYKVKYIATRDNRSFNNYLESLLMKIVSDYESAHGPIIVPDGPSTPDR